VLGGQRYRRASPFLQELRALGCVTGTASGRYVLDYMLAAARQRYYMIYLNVLRRTAIGTRLGSELRSTLTTILRLMANSAPQMILLNGVLRMALPPTTLPSSNPLWVSGIRQTG